MLEAPDEDYYNFSTGSEISGHYDAAIEGTTNLAIIGPGRDLCIFRRTGGTPLGGLYLGDCENIRLEGFSTDCTVMAPSGHHGMRMYNIFGLRTDNLGIFNAPGYGLGVQNDAESTDRIGRWLLNDTLIENTGGDALDIKAPTVNNDQIIISGYRVKGWSRDTDGDMALDNRFCGTVSDVDIEFTDNMGDAYGINLRAATPEHGAAFSIYNDVQIKGNRDTSNNLHAQIGIGAGGRRVNMFGVSVRNLNSVYGSYAVSLVGSDINIYGLNVDRCFGGVAMSGSNITLHNPIITNCDDRGITVVAGARLSNRVIAPRVENCAYAYYAEGGGLMTLERPRGYNNGDLYTLSANCRVLGPAEAIKTVPYASARLATTAYVNLLSRDWRMGSTIDGSDAGDWRPRAGEGSGQRRGHPYGAGWLLYGTVDMALDFVRRQDLDGVILVRATAILLLDRSFGAGATSENGVYVVQARCPRPRDRCRSRPASSPA